MMPMKIRLSRAFTLLTVFWLASCGVAPSPEAGLPAAPALVYVRLDEAGAAQFAYRASLDAPASALALDFPAACAIFALFPDPAGRRLAAEFVCGGSPAVQVYDPDSGAIALPVQETDSRFLAWSADGAWLYLRADTYGSNNVVRYEVDGARLESLSLPAGAYDLAALPGGDMLFSVTQGLGFGSEVYRGDGRGRGSRLLLTEPGHIVAYLRPSPDGGQVAYILIPDSQQPFAPGELWVMDADGAHARFLAEADAGHGYAPAWSPDGSQIAYVGRENPEESQADSTAGALHSNLYTCDLAAGTASALTAFPAAVVETPAWAPDGSALAFDVINDGTINVWVFETASRTLRQLDEDFSCCAAWLAGR